MIYKAVCIILFPKMFSPLFKINTNQRVWWPVLTHIPKSLMVSINTYQRVWWPGIVCSPESGLAPSASGTWHPACAPDLTTAPGQAQRMASCPTKTSKQDHETTGSNLRYKKFEDSNIYNNLHASSVKKILHKHILLCISYNLQKIITTGTCLAWIPAKITHAYCVSVCRHKAII